MTTYTINYNTGVTKDFEGSLEDAKETAVQSMAYTQQNVDILDQNGIVVSTARWYGVEPSEDDEVLERFGSFGFYTPWDDDLGN